MGFVLFVLGLIFILIGKTYEGEIIINISTLLIVIFGMIMLLAESTIVGTIYWKIMLGVYLTSNLISFSLLVFQKPSDYVILVGMGIYTLTYFIWFLKKKKYGHLDLLKLLWALTFVLHPLNKFYNGLPEHFNLASGSIFFVLILDFLAIAAFGPKPFFLRKLPNDF